MLLPTFGAVGHECDHGEDGSNVLVDCLVLAPQANFIGSLTVRVAGAGEPRLELLVGYVARCCCFEDWS
jgi:hypothetical protein